jgi:hypothetical protein
MLLNWITIIINADARKAYIHNNTTLRVFFTFGIIINVCLNCIYCAVEYIMLFPSFFICFIVVALLGFHVKTNNLIYNYLEIYFIS